MANRTTATAVKQIINTDLSDAIVTRFIDVANQVVTERLGTDTSLSDDQKTEIECWLAAHFLGSTREQQAQGESVGGANMTYQGMTAMGLDSTFYGQTVKILDTTGTLAAEVGKRKASITAITSFD